MVISLGEDTHAVLEEIYCALGNHTRKLVRNITRMDADNIRRMVVSIACFTPNIYIYAGHMFRSHIFAFQKALEIVKIKTIRRFELVKNRDLNKRFV
jgi:hypothetical protein